MSHVMSLSCEPSPHALAELALIGSLAGRGDLPDSAPPLGPIVQPFWTASRTLQQGWMADLAGVEEPLQRGFTKFETVTLELFLTELLTRVWATHWTILDRAHGQTDAERLLSNTLSGMGRVRREVLLLMVKHWQGPAAELISRLDRFRRRCERWTDLLIAGPASVHDAWDFAVELERAQDFGLESWSRAAGESSPAALLVSAGLRVMFGTPFPTNCCQRPAFATLMSAALSTLPAAAFHDDGTLKPAGEWPGR